MTVRAALTEYGSRSRIGPTAYMEVDRPDGSSVTVGMDELEDGVFDAQLSGTVAGVYRFHVLATGRTLRGLPFTREHRALGVDFIIGGD